MTGAGKKSGKTGAGRGRGRGRAGATPQTGPSGGPPPVSAYDGPSEQRGRSPSGSTSKPASRASSKAPEGKEKRDTLPKGYNRETRRAPELLKNVDFGGGAYNLESEMPADLMRRPGFGTAGNKHKVNINAYNVDQWPSRSVYQYDILIGSGSEARGLNKAVWESKAVQDVIGHGFIWDGNKIGWTWQKYDREIRLIVDLDAEKGRPPRKSKSGKVDENENKHRVIIKAVQQNQEAKKINLDILRAYLDHQTDFNDNVLQSINFLDHLLRVTPSKHLINLRRSYFSRMAAEGERFLVGFGVEALKGVYQSLRLVEGKKLVINADVSNSCFWQESSLDHVAFQLFGGGNPAMFQNAVMVTKSGREEPIMLKTLRRLCKNKFFVKHRGRSEALANKQYTIQAISDKSADTYKFDVTDPVTKAVTPNVSVRAYFQKKYNIILNKPWLPLVQVKLGEVYPMEICYMASGQRYPYKLNEDQTAKMIKFAVSRPAQRKAAIDHGLSMLKWAEDPMLKNYGMKVNPNMVQTTARILDPPEVLFGKGATARPMFSGRWDLRGKVFLKSNDKPLKSWAVVVLSGAEGGLERAVPTQDQVKAFVQNFLKLYRGHGGVVQETDPPILGGIPDTSKAIETAFYAAGNKAQLRPQMLLIVVTNRSAFIYERVKRNCDCRWGVVSQVVLASNLVKNAPQYCSNVLMKFNCKLGGTTSAIKPRKPFFTEPTMIIGADVSHAAPGISQVSIAAITVSMDTTASRYCAAVQSNGVRREMMSPDNTVNMTMPLIQRWMENVGGGRMPKHVYYFRDGVSEAQYIPLLNNEVADLKHAFLKKCDGRPENMPKFTVVVAEKRHHIRFFPTQGQGMDKNGNPVPGTIVDRDVTHPFENDIYLSAHSAIQGTARPTHYHMIMDEANVPVDKFQALLYEHCYQYQRATTPVSLFPAVYYAHLAAARGYSHINQTVNEAFIERLARERHKEHKNPRVDAESEAPLLTPMLETGQIQFSMWYI